MRELKQLEFEGKHRLIIRSPLTLKERVEIHEINKMNLPFGTVACRSVPARRENEFYKTECLITIESEKEADKIIERAIRGTDFGHANESIIEDLKKKYRE